MSFLKDSKAEMWKTIDDVVATFDSLSLINHGKPTKLDQRITISTPLKFDYNVLNQVSESELTTVEDSDESFGEQREDIKENVADDLPGGKCTTGIGRGIFIRELNKQRLPADNDAIIQAELNELFPYSFSNEAIESYWVPETAVEGQFNYDVRDEIIERSTDVNESTLNPNIGTQEYNAVDARVCSPPLLHPESVHPSEKSSTSPSLSAKQQNVISNGMVSLESFSCDAFKCIRVKPSSTGITIIEDKNRIIRPKKCRNALINNLNRKELSEKQIQGALSTNEEHLVLKTPSDFLVSTAINNSLEPNFFTNIPREKADNSYSRVAKSKKTLLNEISGNHFKLCEEDFPAL